MLTFSFWFHLSLILRYSSNVIQYSAFVIRHPTSVFWRPSVVIPHPSSIILHLYPSFLLHHPSLDIRRSSSVIRHPSSIILHPLSIICHTYYSPSYIKTSLPDSKQNDCRSHLVIPWYSGSLFKRCPAFSPRAGLLAGRGNPAAALQHDDPRGYIGGNRPVWLFSCCGFWGMFGVFKNVDRNGSVQKIIFFW